MLNISVCMPTTGLPRSEFAMSVANMCLHFMNTRIKEEGNQSIILRQWQSSCISNGREQLAMQSIKEGATHILFIDEDIGFDINTLHIMAARELPFLACNYRLRYEGLGFAAVNKDMTGRIETTTESPDLEECAFCGFGFALIGREVFQSIPQPWFPIHWDLESKTYSTEDMPFYLAAREAGFQPMIDHVASKGIVHMGTKAYRWDVA